MNHEKKNESEKVFQVAQVPLGAEVRDRRLTHQRHQMSSERRQKKFKYLNLHTIIMSYCSLIATRNLHAQNNQLVRHLHYTVLRSVERDRRWGMQRTLVKGDLDKEEGFNPAKVQAMAGHALQKHN